MADIESAIVLSPEEAAELREIRNRFNDCVSRLSALHIELDLFNIRMEEKYSKQQEDFIRDDLLFKIK